MIFDYMAIFMNKPMIADQNFTINVYLTDAQEQYILHIKASALLVYENVQHADASITCLKNALWYALSSNQEGLSAVPRTGTMEP